MYLFSRNELLVPTCGPLPWDRVDAPVGQNDPLGERTPEYEFGQRVSW